MLRCRGPPASVSGGDPTLPRGSHDAAVPCSVRADRCRPRKTTNDHSRRGHTPGVRGWTWIVPDSRGRGRGDGSTGSHPCRRPLRPSARGSKGWKNRWMGTWGVLNGMKRIDAIPLGDGVSDSAMLCGTVGHLPRGTGKSSFRRSGGPKTPPPESRSAAANREGNRPAVHFCAVLMALA